MALTITGPAEKAFREFCESRGIKPEIYATAVLLDASTPKIKPVIAKPAVPVEKRRGRPPGAKNKQKPKARTEGEQDAVRAATDKAP